MKGPDTSLASSARHAPSLAPRAGEPGRLRYLDGAARDGVSEFFYIAKTNKIAGTTAGFTMRPIALK